MPDVPVEINIFSFEKIGQHASPLEKYQGRQNGNHVPNQK